MLVLNALQDDFEELPGIMELVRPWQKNRQVKLTEDEVIRALRSLLNGSLITAYVYSPDKKSLVAIGEPDLEDAALRGYWYRPTSTGNQIWGEWRSSANVNEFFGA